MPRTISLCGVLLLAIAATASGQSAPQAPAASATSRAIAPLPHLRVSPDGHHLVREDGAPFLYLGDTAWELFHRLDREEARHYLQTRAAQRFTAIQAVALAELNGITEPNAQGDLPLLDHDPLRPAVTSGADPADPGAYDYWDHVDFIVQEANRLGMYVALLPTWATWIDPRPGGTAYITTAAQAQGYGEFLGRRYREAGIIWVLGGDRPGAGHEAIWRALAKGIALGVSGTEDYSRVLMTYHPSGAQSSSTWFHDDIWLDFNMRQTGHGPVDEVKGWNQIAADYARSPTKPIVDGEPLYEDHPIGFREGARTHGFSTDAHVRQRIYWDLFAGAAGVTYGDHAVWQMYAPGREPVNGPLYFWNEAIERPGAKQMRHVRTLLESRPMLTRTPDQSLLVDALDGAEHIQAIRGPDHLFVYSAAGRPFTLKLGRISGTRVTGYWYNPRNGTSTRIGTFDNAGTREFVPQYDGLGSDWVLVLDDGARGYPAPGRLVRGPGDR